jgi:hypothetical protein
MSRFGPSPASAVSHALRGYALNGIGGIASLEIAIIGGAFSADRPLVGRAKGNEGDRGMSGALIFRLVLLVLVAIAWAWLAFRAVTAEGGFGAWLRAPETGGTAARSSS